MQQLLLKLLLQLVLGGLRQRGREQGGWVIGWVNSIERACTYRQTRSAPYPLPELPGGWGVGVTEEWQQQRQVAGPLPAVASCTSLLSI